MDQKEKISGEIAGNEITPEQVDGMDVRLAALAWENYLKLRANNVSEKESRSALMETMREMLARDGKTANNPPSFDGHPKESAEELKKYLCGELVAANSRLAPLLMKLGSAGQNIRKHANEIVPELVELQTEYASIKCAVENELRAANKDSGTELYKRLAEFNRKLAHITNEFDDKQFATATTNLGKMISNHEDAIDKLERLLEEIRSSKQIAIKK